MRITTAVRRKAKAESAETAVSMLFSSSKCPVCDGVKFRGLITCLVCWELVKPATRRALMKPDQKSAYRIAGFLAWLSVGARVQSIGIDSGRRADYGPPTAILAEAARGKLRGKRLEQLVKGSGLGGLHDA